MQMMCQAYGRNFGISVRTRARGQPARTFYQSVFVRGRGASKHAKLWPDLVNPLLLNLEGGNTENPKAVKLLVCDEQKAKHTRVRVSDD